MQQDKALQILKENLPSFAEEYGVKKIGVFPLRRKQLGELQMRVRKLLRLSS